MSRQRPATARITQTTGFWELRAEQVMDRIFGGSSGRATRSQGAIADRDAHGPAPESAPAIDVVVQQPWADSAAPATAPDLFNASLPVPAVAVAARAGAQDATHAREAAHASAAARVQIAANAHAQAAAGEQSLASPVPATGGASAAAGTPTSTQLLLWGSLFSLPLLVLVGVLMRNLNHSETALNQERNLLLLERLRALSGPAPTAETTADGGREAGHGSGSSDGRGADGLPPPPPNDDWITELGQLPQSSAPRAEVLRVPPSPRITAAAPAAGSGASSGPSSGSPPNPAGPVPVLMGVIHTQGRGGSAIFQVGGASANAAIGDLIGGSGWRLRATSSDSVLIVRGGEQRRLSISTAP